MDKIEIDGERYEQLLEFERKQKKEYEIVVTCKCLLCHQFTKETRMSQYKNNLTYTVPKCEKCFGSLMNETSEQLVIRIMELVDKYEERLMLARRV